MMQLFHKPFGFLVLQYKGVATANKFTTTWCCMLFSDPIGVAQGDNVLLHYKTVQTECMFGFDPNSACNQCITNKFWAGSFKEIKPSTEWIAIDFKLTSTGDRCTQIKGLYTAKNRQQ